MKEEKKQKQQSEDIGLVVADNDEQAFWMKIKSDSERDIEGIKKQLKFLEAVLELSNTRIENAKE